ncbi:MAG: nickel pincer cofactor biosynthesis protein LarC [Candidatus Bathyarchaeota archaeon]|nr:nickel pincer cofactor biosynthesis protein LarC [Candidatus Bathyarchaeota archaeon]
MPEFDRVLVIDCQVAGISGDMLLGALLDIGADTNKVSSAINSLENQVYGYRNVKIDIQPVMRSGFKATKVEVTAESTSRKNGNELVETIEESAKNLRLSPAAQQFASNTVRTLVSSEAKIHGKSIADAHLHEVGLVDTPAEILGVAVAMDDLELFNAKIIATPVSVGGGLFKFSHGITSSPAPATLEILRSKNFPLRGGPVESELATPTGASILVNLACETSRFYPEMIPLKTGYGAGSRDFQEMPNVLRLTIGEPLDNWLLSDAVAILETNLDDVGGEIIGNSVDELLREGAKDVSIIPMFTKKNRPGQILKIVADKKDVKRLSRVLMEQTGTLGVRVYPCERHILNREIVSVDVLIDDAKETARVKVAKTKNGKVLSVKPEYEDAKCLSAKTGKSLREINEIVTMKAREVFSKR